MRHPCNKQIELVLTNTAPAFFPSGGKAIRTMTVTGAWRSESISLRSSCRRTSHAWAPKTAIEPTDGLPWIIPFPVTVSDELLISPFAPLRVSVSYSFLGGACCQWQASCPARLVVSGPRNCREISLMSCDDGSERRGVPIRPFEWRVVCDLRMLSNRASPWSSRMAQSTDPDILRPTSKFDSSRLGSMWELSPDWVVCHIHKVGS